MVFFFVVAAADVAVHRWHFPGMPFRMRVLCFLEKSEMLTVLWQIAQVADSSEAALVVVAFALVCTGWRQSESDRC